jgi:hypothetical protein
VPRLRVVVWGRGMGSGGGGDVWPRVANGARRCRGPADGEAPHDLARGPPTSCTRAEERGTQITGRGPASACAYGVVWQRADWPCARSRAHAVLMRFRAPQFRVALFD